MLTCRPLDYTRTITIFSVDIGVPHVTKHSRLYAVTSTTCSTLLLAATHGHVASTSPAHPLSVPVRHPSDKGSVVRDSGRSID